MESSGEFERISQMKTIETATSLAMNCIPEPLGPFDQCSLNKEEQLLRVEKLELFQVFWT